MLFFFFNSPLALCMCLSLFLLKAFCSAGTAANCSVLEAIEPYKLVSGGEKEMQHTDINRRDPNTGYPNSLLVPYRSVWGWS